MRFFCFATFVLLASAGALAEYGTFNTRQRAYEAGTVNVTGQSDFPMDVALADYDGDGNLDAALGCWGWWYPAAGIKLSNGQGGFLPASWYPIGTPAMAIEAGDFNGDSKPDFAVAEYNYGVGNRVAVFLNSGNGTFGAAMRYPCATGPRDIKVADMDNDGDQDIVITGSSASAEAFSILRNNGSGNFSNRVDIPAGGSPHMLAIGDLNGDGVPDLAASRQFWGGQGIVILSHSWMSYQAAQAISVPGAQAGGTGVEIGDLDSDGDMDLVFGNGSGDSSISGYRNDGSGVLTGPIQIPIPAFMYPMWDMEIADMDNDGDKDIVGVAAANNDGFTIIRSDGPWSFDQNPVDHPTGEDNWGLQVADLNRDGFKDVIVADAGSNHLTVHESEQGQFNFPDFYPVNTAGIMRECATGDLDGDGDLDAMSIGNRLIVMRNDGSGNFNIEVDDSALPPLDRAKLRDLDGDGDLDIVCVKNLIIAQPPYDVYTSLNDGAGNFGPFWIQSAQGSAGIGEADAADLDGDGDLDLVASEGRGAPGMSRRIYSWENTGNPALFAAPWIYSNPGILGGERLSLGDLNGDGKQDAMLGGQVVFLGVGNRTFTYHGVSDPGPGPIRGAKVADLNQDGKLDVATVTHGGAVQDREAVGVRLGQGNGNFLPVKLYYGMYSRSLGGSNTLDIFDANGDGKPDIAATSYGSRDVSVFLGLGDGTFGPENAFGVRGSTMGVASGDFNADGRPDMVSNTHGNLPNPSGMSVLFGLEPQVHLLVPTQYSITEGLPFGGELIDLFTKNNSGVNILSEELTPNSTIVFESVALGNTATHFEVEFWANATRLDQSALVDLYDYQSNQWVTVGMQLLGHSATRVSAIAPAPLNRWIHATTRKVKMRLRLVPQTDSNIVDGWATSIDQAIWRIRH